MRSLATIAAAAMLVGCTATPEPIPVNAALAAAPPAAVAPAVEGDVVALSFSGGGARAAAFSLGVLQGLREMRTAEGASLLDRVILITGVSGGAITAAYYGQHGAAGLDSFRAAYLDKDWEADLHTSPFSPANWLRLYQGGLNDRALLADWLDREVFTGAHMRDLDRPGAPHIWINATELFHGVPFAFTPYYFQALCSDLDQVRVADAVAASMSVPIAFRPVLLETHPESCAAPLPAWVDIAVADRGAPALVRATARAFQDYRDPERMRYLHLVDGGVTDNFGLSTLMVTRRASDISYGPFTAQDAVRVRRLVFLVVNSELPRQGEWPLAAQGPGGAEVLTSALDASIDFGKRVAYDGFRDMIALWERDVRAYRCTLSPDQVLRLRGTLDGWDCTDVHFSVDMLSFSDLDAEDTAFLIGQTTRVSLPADTIDALIAGGREAVLANAAAKSLED